MTDRKERNFKRLIRELDSAVRRASYAGMRLDEALSAAISHGTARLEQLYGPAVAIEFLEAQKRIIAEAEAKRSEGKT